jgi:hypothetical protein
VGEWLFSPEASQAMLVREKCHGLWPWVSEDLPEASFNPTPKAKITCGPADEISRRNGRLLAEKLPLTNWDSWWILPLVLILL